MVSLRLFSAVLEPLSVLFYYHCCSPFYTSDIQHNSESCFLQKLLLDSALVVCIRGGSQEKYELSELVDWNQHNHLLLNINETKEMVFDFRRRRAQLDPVLIQGAKVRAGPLLQISEAAVGQ